MRIWMRSLLACCALLPCWELAVFGQARLATDSVELEAEVSPAEEDLIDAVGELDKSPSFVRLIKLPLPIQGTVDTQVRRSIEQILSNVDSAQTRPTIVLEFATPPDGTGESSEFGRSLDLARYLAGRETSQARIVAYLPTTVRGHAVLVALACEEIIMHPDARIGEAGVSESDIDDTMRRAYGEIAGRRLTIPSAVAIGLLDPNAQVQRLTTAKGTRYALDADVAQIQAETNVLKIDTVIPAGDVGLLVGDKLRLDYGFVSHLAADRQALAAALEIPVADLEIDPLLTGEWSAVRVDLSGPISPVLVDQTLRSLEDALQGEAGVNFICLALDSPGGSIDDSLRLATYLSDLDSTKIRTVAYVPREARSDAALIAVACDKVAVETDAILGGGGATNFSSEEMAAAAISAQEILSQKGRSWSLPVAMIDSERVVHRYQLIGSTTSEYFCDEELSQQSDPEGWRRGEEVSATGELLQLTGEQAREMRIAHEVVADYAEFQQAFQLESPPQVLEANWAQQFIGALANRRVAAGLLMIGFLALLIELNAPGIGVGGFVASVCFLLFFWSNFLSGTAGWLEVLLFLAGMVFISLEVLVLPGFGIFGLGGAMMVIASLVLASQTFIIPQNAYQMQQLPRSLLMVATALAGVGIGAILLHRFLGDSPLMRRFILQPAEGEAAAELERRESVVRYDHLLNKQGYTTTQLTPSGKADFEGQLYDVVSDGLLIPRATNVEVVDVIGNKIVVRKVRT